MQAIAFVLLCLTTLVLVAFRRLFRGPLHPGWSYRFEALAEILRKANQRGVGMPVERMRRGLLPAPIHRKIASSIRHERTILAGRPTETFTPIGWTAKDPTVLYFHGGGYIVCSPATHRDLVSRIAAASGARCLAIDYRKAPEHPFPLPIDDCEAAYREVLEAGTDATRLFVGGDSAGGGLTLAVLQRARDAGLPLPVAGILLSPWVDLECTGDSIRRNAPFDYLPVDGLRWGADQYLQGADRSHPHVSAVHADLSGLPPLLVQTGSAELFLSENVRLAERATAAGIDVTHEIDDGMFHVYQAFATLVPESSEPAIARIGAFVRARHAASYAENAENADVELSVSGAA